MARFLNFNIGGNLKDKSTELLILLKDYNVHIATLTETWLKTTDKIKFPGYSIYRKDRDARGGGVAILVRNDIKHTLIPSDLNSDDEIISIHVQQLANLSNLAVTSLYIPPNKPLNPNTLITLAQNNNRCIISGDFNAKNTMWNCSSTNLKGNLIEKLLEVPNYDLIFPDSPTRIGYNNNADSTIDLTITKNLTNIYSTCIVLDDGPDSDHKPVLTTFKLTFKFHDKRLIPDYKNADWDQFKISIADNITISNATSIGHIDQNVLNLENSIINAFTNYVPKIKITNYSGFTPSRRTLELIKT